MGGYNSEEDASLSLDWTDDENEITTPSETGKEMVAFTSQSKLVTDFVGMGFSLDNILKSIEENGEDDADAILQTLLGCSSSAPSTSQSKIFSQFIKMGFPSEMVSKAIDETGEENPDLILETLLTLSALDGLVQNDESQVEPKSPVSNDGCDLFSDDEIFDAEEEVENLCGEEGVLAFMMQMGYGEDEVKTAMDRSGQDASVGDLNDMILAARMAKEADADFDEQLFSGEDEEKPSVLLGGCSRLKRKGKWTSSPSVRVRLCRKQKVLGNSTTLSFNPFHMVGFGVPNGPLIQKTREINDQAIGPPYFYYENVAIAPKNVWETISECLYGVEPEFVDSIHFCAAARKRGYIHNLPIHNRFPLEPPPPLTIQEALPHTKHWWPSWDTRIKLNCIQGACASAKLTERLQVLFSECKEDPPPPTVQQYAMDLFKKWNLVWIGMQQLAPLEPDEMEMLLGFPKNHTRGGGINRTDRYKSLGNTFQVDTVAYHLSVLKSMFPNGMRVLSLFSGIGGAEVALHRLGIFLKVVVAVEISEANRNILRSWWNQSNQKGTLIDIADVRELKSEQLQQLIRIYGGFDLIIGGSPCNNISGSNRVSRDGLAGVHSSLFFEYTRILNEVKRLMRSESCS